MSIEAGQVIDGKYRVVKLLGQGGMGAVYLAEHMVIGRRVALKVLLGNVAGNETAVARFEREAQAAGRIGNDHILEIFDFGSLPDGARYMVCEFLEGETLAARLTREVRMQPASLLPIARQLLSGLGAAHQAGVVHRDLKPENVFVLRQKAGIADFVKIIDFGISKFQPLSTGEGMQMTATGIVVGTPCYLSPEQARGSREADARSDLYAVGVILYECVTGTLPFDAQNINDLLFKIVLEAPRPLRETAPDLDPAFAQIIETAMARDPEQRFQSAVAFTAALDSWAAQRGIALPERMAQLTPSGGGMRSGDVRLPSGSTRSLAPTPGTWADSHVSVSAFQPKPSKARWLVLGAVVAVVIAGGAFAALGSGADKHEAPTAASVPATVAPSVEAAPPSPPPLATTPPAPPDAVAPVVTAAPGLDSVNVARDVAEPSVGVVAPHKAALVTAKHGAASTPKKAAAEAEPPPPPAPPQVDGTKHHRDFGY